jgi:hypothetical protein
MDASVLQITKQASYSGFGLSVVESPDRTEMVLASAVSTPRRRSSNRAVLMASMISAHYMS